MRIAHSYLWLERPDARLRILMLHHACGSAMSYLPLAKELPDWCEPYLFELAGRGVREGEPFAENYAAAVAELVSVAVGLVDRPTVLFGHSLGGQLAHSLACALAAERPGMVKAVVLSSAYSPASAVAMARHPAAPFQLRTREELLEELRGRGGCPEEMLDDPDFVEHALLILGHDLHLADTYVPTSGADADYHVWYGRDDSYYDEEQVLGWISALSGKPEVRDFRGGHFYLTQGPEPLAALQNLVTEVDETCVAPGR